jgi:hypothetical protein
LNQDFLSALYLSIDIKMSSRVYYPCLYRDHPFFSVFVLHGYMDASAAAMYDPHSGHRPGLPGLPPHHSPHMNHAAAASMHGYHGTPSHVSQATNHMGAVQPDKRDKEAIYG